MKILLLGADGQLGLALRATLPAVGEVIACTRRGLGTDLACDLMNTDALKAVLRLVRPDLVVNAAAYTAVDLAESDPATAAAVNCNVPLIIGATVSEWNGAVIHYSTDYVFNGEADQPYNEFDAVDPPNVYGKTKYQGEQALIASGADYLILRTAWVYGIQGRNFLTTMLRLARANDVLRVVDDQRGTPTTVNFLAGATAVIAGCWMSNPDSRRCVAGIYHLTAAGETTWHGFARQIFIEALATGHIEKLPSVVPIPTIAYPTPARRPAYSVLDCTRARTIFKISIPDWNDDLRQLF